MKDFEVFAEVRFYTSLGHVQANNEDEAIKKAEDYYKRNENDIGNSLWEQSAGVEVYDFSADSEELLEGREYLNDRK